MVLRFIADDKLAVALAESAPARDVFGDSGQSTIV